MRALALVLAIALAIAATAAVGARADGTAADAHAADSDYYELLGVMRDADTAAIRAAFKRLARTEHPDRHPNDPAAHERFLRINRAYEVLKDETLRRRYDLGGARTAPLHWRAPRRPRDARPAVFTADRTTRAPPASRHRAQARTRSRRVPAHQAHRRVRTP